MKTSILFLFFLTCSLFAAAQTTISGNVTDQKGNTLIGANIFLKDTYDGASSDTNGNFSFETEETGTHTIVAGYIGYEGFEQTITVNGTPVELVIVLQQVFNELNAATITVGAFEASDEKKAVMLKPLDIVTTAGAAGDIAGALNTLPGTTQNAESGRLFVRGGDSRESQIFIDGTRVFSPYTNSAPNTAVRGRFNPFLFSGTAFSTGGYSAEYGEALSSVLVLNTVDMPAESRYDFSIMSVGGDATAVKKWDKSALSASAGYTNLAPYLAITPARFEFDKPFQSGNAALNYRKELPGGMFKVFAQGNRTAFKAQIPSPDFENGKMPFDMLNDNFYGNVSAKSAIGEKWIGYAGVGYSLDKNNITIDQQKLNSELGGLHGKLTAKYLLSNRVKILFGSELFSEKYIESIGQQTTNFSRDYNFQGVGLFTEGEFYLSQKIALRAGLRGDLSNFTTQKHIAPRLSAAYKAGENLQFSMAYGQFFQNASSNILVQTQDLKKEQSEQIIGNIQWQKEGRLLRVEAYQKNYGQLAKFSDTGINNDGDGYARGLDVFYKDERTIKEMQFWVSYSFLDTKRNYLNFPESATPRFAARHNLSLVAKRWIDPLKMLVGGTFSYGSARSFDDPNTPEFMDGKMTPFRTLNLNVSYLHRQNIIFYASASNVLGFKNSFGEQFSANADQNGQFTGQTILPNQDRFFFIGCFITLSRNKEINQLDQID